MGICSNSKASRVLNTHTSLFYLLFVVVWYTKKVFRCFIFTPFFCFLRRPFFHNDLFAVYCTLLYVHDSLIFSLFIVNDAHTHTCITILFSPHCKVHIIRRCIIITRSFVFVIMCINILLRTIIINTNIYDIIYVVYKIND